MIQDPSLLLEIDRNARKFSLWPVEVSSLSALGDMSSHTSAFLKSEAFHEAWSKRLRRDVMTGIPLQDLIKAATTRLDFELSPSQDKEIELFEWTRRIMTRATMSAIYGPHNPYDLPGVEEALFEWLGNSSCMMMGPLARWLSPKAFHARGIVASALAQYFERGYYAEASLAVKDRQRLYQDKITFEEQGRIEATLSSALVGNTFTSAFWVVFNVWSNADLLSDVGNEVMLLKTGPDSDDSNLKRPLLDSVILETLRLNSGAANSRQVVDDTVIGGYALKKEKLILMPLNALHLHESWVSSAGEFNPRRFQNDVPDRSTFRAFGAGPFTCPGQSLARAMISKLIATLCSSFDIIPLDESGWTKPTLAGGGFLEIMPSPEPTTRVRMSVIC